jgi:hypothetical protein
MTTLHPDFLRTLIIVTGFRGSAIEQAEAALLLIGLEGGDFCAGQLPAEITNGDKHLSGCATAALITMGLVEVMGRIKSPNPDANGRKMNLLRIPAAKISTARTWLRIRGYHPADAQFSIPLSA